VAAGTDLKVVSQILGHSTIALTANTYTGVLPALQREASDRLRGIARRAGGRPPLTVAGWS